MVNILETNIVSVFFTNDKTNSDKVKSIAF